jgi:hypothetical protein
MRGSVRIGTTVLLLWLQLLAWGDGKAWAKHYRVVAEPCPGHCTVTRLTNCSTCMGVRTCAQQHACSNNRAVACGEVSTVSIPCWRLDWRW